MGTRDQMAEQCHPTCGHCMSTATYSAVPAGPGLLSPEIQKLGAAGSYPHRRQETLGILIFPYEIKSTHFLPLTRIHNLAMDGRAESSGPRAGIIPSFATGACHTAQPKLSLSLPPAPICSTDTINTPTRGHTEPFAHNHKVLCSSKINTLSLVGI